VSVKTARIWDARTGTEIACLKSHMGSVLSAAFSPDGSRIVTTSRDNTARMWDARTGTEIACLQAHTDWVQSAAFSPDGSRIVTASRDKTARIWGVSRTEVLVGERAVVLTAALAHGIGRRTDTEKADLLMQNAPEDLYEAARAQLLNPTKWSPQELQAREQALDETTSALHAPLSPQLLPEPDAVC
jgi:WD40 repeat protein